MEPFTALTGKTGHTLQECPARKTAGGESSEGHLQGHELEVHVRLQHCPVSFALDQQGEVVLEVSAHGNTMPVERPQGSGGRAWSC